MRRITTLGAGALMLTPLGALAEDASPLIGPECPDGKTGPACQWTCEEESECGFTLYQDGDGGVVGVRVQGAILANSPSPGEDPAELFSFQMENGAEGLVREVDTPRRFSLRESRPSYPQGGLLVRTFSQSYRGVDLLPSASQVRVVYSPLGVVRVSGRLVNNAVPYENASVKTPFEGAAEAIADLYRQQVPGSPDNLDVQTNLVAIPEIQEVGVLGIVRGPASSVLARVVVEAAPSGRPRLLVFQEIGASGLVDSQPVTVGTVTQDTPNFSIPDVTVEQASTDLSGAPLLGSIDDFSGDIQLGSERIVSMSLGGADFSDALQQAERLTSASGVFPGTGMTALDRQMFYQAATSYYELIDNVVTLDNGGVITRHWDSANPVYSSPPVSGAAPGLFQPRIVIFTEIAAGDSGCPDGFPACVTPFGLAPGAPEEPMYPEFVHLPPTADGMPNSLAEVLAGVHMPNGTADPEARLFAHEAGHALDLFLGPGVASKFTPPCPSGGCQASCQENTTEEAAPLVESIANGFSIQLLHRFYDYPSANPCDFFFDLVTSGSVQNGPGDCLPQGGNVAVLTRGDPCTDPGGNCDKPSDPGFRTVCCDPVDPDCTETNSDCALGGSRFVPTGSCDANLGYRTTSILHAFWQVLSGLNCSPAAPSQCVDAGFSAAVDPADMLLRSWVYALKLDPGIYQELFDDMATYVGCNYDQPTFEAFNAILCTHELLPCNQPVPVSCQVCGNGVLEAGEECDGDELTLLECADLPVFTDGELACTQSCTFDTTMCQIGGADSTTSGGAETTSTTSGSSSSTSGSTSGITGGTDTEPASDGGGGGGGCRVGDGPPRAWWPAICVLPLMVGRRRRERGI